MQVGQVTADAEITVDTVRFYQRRGGTLAYTLAAAIVTGGIAAPVKEWGPEHRDPGR